MNAPRHDLARRRHAALMSVLDGALETMGGEQGSPTTGPASQLTTASLALCNLKTKESPTIAAPMSYQTSTLLRENVSAALSSPMVTNQEQLLLAMAAENRRKMDMAKLLQGSQMAYQRRNRALLQQLLRSQNDLSLVSQGSGITNLGIPVVSEQVSTPISPTKASHSQGAMVRTPASILHELGSNGRRPGAPYIDVSQWPVGEADRSRTNRGGVKETFPEKVYRMLVEMEKEGKSDMLGFFSHGRAFAIHDQKEFVSEILPRYFKQSTMSAFCRQLNLYGFTRIRRGPDAGGWYHELFLRGKPALMSYMRRVGVPTAGQDRRKTKPKMLDFHDPDFYAMPRTTL